MSLLTKEDYKKMGLPCGTCKYPSECFKQEAILLEIPCRLNAKHGENPLISFAEAHECPGPERRSLYLALAPPG